MDKTLPSLQCLVCGSKESLLKCAGCKVVCKSCPLSNPVGLHPHQQKRSSNLNRMLMYDPCAAYCGKEHQTTEWAKHKHACTQVKRARNKVQRKEDELNSMPSSFMFKARPFENRVGDFWGLPDTRDYMRARFGLIEALLNVVTKEAVQEAHDHMMDLLRLNHSDNMGLRFLLPAMQIRLSKDYEAYRYIKWWFIHDNDSYETLQKGYQPFIESKNANALEMTQHVTCKYSQLGHKVALALIKIRMLKDLKTLNNSTAMGEKVPQELLESVQTYLITPTLASDTALLKDVKDGKSLRSRIEELALQVTQMMTDIEVANEHFWPALFDPDEHLNARPSYYSQGTLAEAQLALKYGYRSWVETPGAIELVKQMWRAKAQ